MPTTTSRLGLTEPVGGDAPSELRVSITNNAVILDNAVTYSSGTLASLPAASLAGRRYYATDIAQELYDTGASWISVGSATPIGAMMQYGGASDPVDPDGATRWLVCDGRAISRSTYSRAFTALGTTFGSGNGTTTFNIPDLRGRVPAGVDDGAGRMSTYDGLGQSSGEASHTLITAEMPSHQHTFDSTEGTIPVSTGGEVTASDAQGYASGSAIYTPITTGTWLVGGISAVDAAGGGGAHNNLQPYLVVNHIVKVL